MERIQLGVSPEEFLSDMKPLETLEFSRDSENTYPIKENIKHPKINKKIYTSIESLVLGQFIMLEQIITGKTKLADHLIDLEIAKLIIRPIEHNVFDNENSIVEKQNEQEILDCDVLEVYWILEKFIEARDKTLFKDFSGVFYDPKDEEEEEDEIEQENTSEMLFSQQWYWYSIVRMLAKEDVTRYGDIYMLPMSTVLPEMSFLAQRNKIESANQRQQEALRKL